MTASTDAKIILDGIIAGSDQALLSYTFAKRAIASASAFVAKIAFFKSTGTCGGEVIMSHNYDILFVVGEFSNSFIAYDMASCLVVFHDAFLLCL